MTSQELREFLKLYYEQGYQIYSLQLAGHKNGRVHSKVQLFKNSEILTLESIELDFHRFLIQFKDIINQDGKRKIAKIKDTGAYYQAIQDLLDIEETKLRQAIKDNQDGKSSLQPGFWDRLDTALVKLLFERPRRDDPDLIWLRKNHFQILAHYIVQKALLKKHQEEESFTKHQDIPQICEKVQSILTNGFLLRKKYSNVLLAYKNYRNLLPDTLEDHTTRMAIQIIYRNDLLRMLKETGSKEKRVRILYILDMYRRYYELTRPILDLLRIAIQLFKGEKNPRPSFKDVDLVYFLKTHDYRILTESFEPVIRHCESHLATRFDESKETVRFTKRKKLRRVTELELTYDEMVNKMDYLKVVLLYALYYAFYDFDDMFKLILLPSVEYKQLLVTRTTR